MIPGSNIKMKMFHEVLQHLVKDNISFMIDKTHKDDHSSIGPV